mmetsp:Transcript_17460/g.33160  ORF Transcript_17460/g.33160 Transcript_17460/m.33160 type:complete len:203 (-) Transcript_17460:1020-1628(-)
MHSAFTKLVMESIVAGEISGVVPTHLQDYESCSGHMLLLFETNCLETRVIVPILSNDWVVRGGPIASVQSVLLEERQQDSRESPTKAAAGEQPARSEISELGLLPQSREGQRKLHYFLPGAGCTTKPWWGLDSVVAPRWLQQMEVVAAQPRLEAIHPPRFPVIIELKWYSPNCVLVPCVGFARSVSRQSAPSLEFFPPAKAP